MTVDFEAQTLGAFRGCRHGDAIAYRATLETTGPQDEEIFALVRGPILVTRAREARRRPEV